MTRALALASARIRLPAQYLGVVLIVVALLLGAVTERAGTLPIALAGVALLGLAILGTFLGPPLSGVELQVESPVRGRWTAVNSPATKTPSHGTYAYGQQFAVDLVHTPAGVERPGFGAGSGFLRPDRFPAFGRPVLAPADGRVVRAVDRMRDHRSRSSWVAYGFFFLEALPRELLGPSGVLGNHLVVRLEDGTHFVLAHLQRRSVAVRVGDHVRAGQEVARCGSSGNTTEPHLHCQRQDVAATFLAAGLPWTIAGSGIPPTGDAFDA